MTSIDNPKGYVIGMHRRFPKSLTIEQPAKDMHPNQKIQGKS